MQTSELCSVEVKSDAQQEYTAQGSLLKHMSLLPALARQRAQADAMLLTNVIHVHLYFI